ncbi:MAG: hypothetical protein HIU86_14675 [Acidobacteria bacterium]|nr:hypothetical protein [Acidobacteriota bacterium]
MNRHRITYEVLETATGVRYRATCQCGARRDSRSHHTLSAWGPEHVVSAFEKGTAAV